MTNMRIVEGIGTVAVLPPSSQAAGATSTPGGLMSQFRKHLYTLIVGAVANAATVDMKLQASTDGTGAGAGAWTDFPGASIATLAAPGVAQIEIAGDRWSAANLGQYVRCVVTATGGACQTCLLVQGADSRYKPASDYNAITVAPAVFV